MTVLARAPFLTVLAALAAVSALWGRVDSRSLPPIALLVAMGIAAASFSGDRKGQGKIVLLVLLITLCASCRVVLFLDRADSAFLGPFPFLRSAGTVVEVRPWGERYAAAVSTSAGGFVLTLPFAELAEGERIYLEGVPLPFRRGEAGEFREDRFWGARRMSARLKVLKMERLPGDSWNIHRWRYTLYRTLSLRVPELTAAYLNAAWTGKRDPKLNRSHSSWGTSHLLAVSGFHVGLVMGAGTLLFRRGKRRVLALSLLLWGYVLLSGAPVSAQRAALMIQAALLGELAGRPACPLNSVSLAAVLLLMASPLWFWDIGWRLSVLAALAIAALLEASGRSEGWIWLLMSPLIWIVTFPQVSWTFGAVPLAGVLINLAALPFFAFALSLASILAVLRILGLPGAAFLLNGTEGCFVLWSLLADRLSGAVAVQLPWSAGGAFFCTGILIALLCRALRMPLRNMAFFVPLATFVGFVLFV